MATRSTRLGIVAMTIIVITVALVFILNTAIVFGEGGPQVVNQQFVSSNEGIAEVAGQPFCMIGTAWGKSFNHKLFAIGCLNVPAGTYTFEFGDGQSEDFQLLSDGSVAGQLSHWYDYVEDTAVTYEASLSVPVSGGGSKSFTMDVVIDSTPPTCSIVVKDGGTNLWKKLELACTAPAQGLIEFGDGAVVEVSLQGGNLVTTVNHLFWGTGVYVPKLYIAWGDRVVAYYGIVLVHPEVPVKPILTLSVVYVPMAFSS